MKEQTIQKNIVKYLESEGCYVIKVVSATKAGVLDIVFCYDGLFGTIEVKRPETRNDVSPLQKHNGELCMEAGGSTMVAGEVGMVKEFLEKMR